MPKKSAVTAQIKFIGGPKDGEVMSSPWDEPQPSKLHFKSPFLAQGEEHWYNRVSSYRIAGNEVHLYEYGGVLPVE